ncbi:hypothetical protein CIW52_28890 [Mycolicibacterium sp. P9-64]|uniref:hypothetical protein n=1 Tax=Mycolicibacterium sp. P9-64 TaxID=2024612 RepID=UPI0011EE6A36|nr:hypothetical protein [Mycolicibacterium sp. P9-64]KAA0079056.1 hypothetical protein CIW52_28890 [Mycolicibacterium sp. P9-64]
MLPVPEAGLDHVLRAWVGRGQLVKVLNQLAADELPRSWRPEDTALRADLMLFLDLVPLISRLPRSVRQWSDLLPAQSRRRQAVADSPSGATSWVDTRRRYGWPPSAFVNRHRERVAHELLSSVLAWVGGEVLRLSRRASTIDGDATSGVSGELDALAAAFDVGLVSPGADEPRPSELAAVEREGSVWRRLIDVARRLRAASVPELAAELLLPVPELRPTLFQLGVVGELLMGLQSAGASITSTSPLSFVTGREQFHVSLDGRVWHLWMEAGGSWQRYGVSSLYRSLSTALRAQTRPLAPDLMLILPGEAAFVIECKYSANADYVGRTGLAQTLLYMTDVGASMASRVEGVVVAPEGVVGDATVASTPAGRLGLASPSAGVERAVDFMAERVRPFRAR